MSAAKHAPGPWSCIVEGNDAFVMPAGGSPCVTLIKLRGAGTSYSESLANARLIAAAPCLLDALRDVVAVLDMALMVGIPTLPAGADGPAVKARAAIAKATGEGA